MGLFCCKYDGYDEYYKYNYNNDKKFKKCMKCHDDYNIKKNITRTHCRFHRPNINNICIDCKQNLNYTNKNCYHIHKITWYERLFD